MYRIEEINALDTLEKTGFQTGTITALNRQTDTADINCNGSAYTSIPVFYNAPCAGGTQSNGSLAGCSDAFASGDEVIVRFYSGRPSHIIGFSGFLWPCIATPAFVFGSDSGDLILNERHIRFDDITDSRFYDRYTPTEILGAEAEISTYINEPDADVSSGFISFQTHWTDSMFHRETQFLFNGEPVYSTYNYETYSNVFNGTRSNVFGAYIHQQTGWGAAFYQINTFYDWKPRTFGRVEFDFYFYSSTTGSVKIASAVSEVTGGYSKATGTALETSYIKQSADMIFTGLFSLWEAESFTSDGSTNLLNTGEPLEKKMVNISEENTGITPLPEAEGLSESYDIYIKNR